MGKGKELFPRRPVHKGDNGTKVCDLCPLSTDKQAIGIFFDSNRPIGDQTIRFHLWHLVESPAVMKATVSHWGIEPSQQQPTLTKGGKDEEAVD